MQPPRSSPRALSLSRSLLNSLLSKNIARRSTPLLQRHRGRRRRRRCAVVFAAAALPIVVHVSRSARLTPFYLGALSGGGGGEGGLPPPTPTTTTTSWKKKSSSSYFFAGGPSPSASSAGSGPRFLRAEEIIERSYGQTFGALSTEASCGPDTDGRSCVASLLDEAMGISNSSSSSSSSSKSFPWWFVTMLRDLRSQNYIQGAWHNLTVLDPPMDYCTIEKVATTQWRNVQCYLNEGMEPRRAPTPCHLNGTALTARRDRSERISRAVMLRDPLERLLSGYLDKCVFGWNRRNQGHCMPNSVFNDTDHTRGIRDDPRMLFAAYVDAFPLGWDMHFFPQSMYCDCLFRHVGEYDFVGIMDGTFFRHLGRMAEKFGGGDGGNNNRLPEALDRVFHFSENTDVSNVGRETRSPTHVREYYTAASVRRALEYFAVDYVKLGLEVPGWARDMLAEEEKTLVT